MQNKIANYLLAGYPMLQITSHEEMRVMREIDGAIDSINKDRPDETKHYSVYTWTYTQGITKRVKAGMQAETISDTQDPIAMATAFASLPERSVLVALDYHHFTADPPPMLVRHIKQDCQIGKENRKHIIVVGCSGKIAPEIQKCITLVEFKLPDRAALNEVLKMIETSTCVNCDETRDALLDAASGLTTLEAEDAFSLAFIESGKQSIPAKIVAREKANTVRKNGVLEIIESKFEGQDVGGLHNLKAWITKRKHAFTQKAKDFGLPAVKGCCAVGVPGSGKTAMAKATASIFGVPLLKLDGGKIFGSLVGQSEANLRSAIETAEAIAPCVLLCDELEKSFSGSQSSGQTDGGTSSRVLGTFLQWLNDKTSQVFVFATANDVSKLPPELLRKGRWDELWTVDIPDHKERAEIIAIQTRRHKRTHLFSLEDIQSVVKATPQFTGAEIEAAFNEGLYTAFDADRELTPADVIHAASNIIPLAKTMSDQVKAIQEWGKGRARPASESISESFERNTRTLLDN